MPAIAKLLSIAIIAVVTAGALGGAYITTALNNGSRTTLATGATEPSSTISSSITSSKSSTESSVTQIWSMPPPKSGNATYNGEWFFSARESQGETTIQVNANLTYIAKSNATFEFGEPNAIARVEAANGTIVWQEISTDLLVLENVSYGRSYVSQVQVPTSNLELNQNYTLTVYPQLNASGGFLGNDLQVEFVFSPLATTD
jgi:hypothetical protein